MIEFFFFFRTTSTLVRARVGNGTNDNDSASTRAALQGVKQATTEVGEASSQLQQATRLLSHKAEKITAPFSKKTTHTSSASSTINTTDKTPMIAQNKDQTT